MEYTGLPLGASPPAPAYREPDAEASLQQLLPRHGISFFEDSLPPAIEEEMTRFYANLFSSPAKFRIYGQLVKVSTYVARTNGRTTAIFVLQNTGNEIHVLNEQIHIPETEIIRFADYIFERYRTASVIRFKAIDTRLTRFSYPCQRTYFTNDVVLPLPDSVPAYLESLGKSTRDNIKRYLKLLKRDFPSHAFHVHEKNEGGDELFHSIVGFNRSRMKTKRKISGINTAESERLHALVRKCGLLCTITIDGRVCAGTICYQFGDNYFMRVIAHDSVYSDYRLGLLCCYLTIAECILRGGKNYHFLWGREEYKYRFLGQHRSFDSLTIYRSGFHYLANLFSIIKTASKARFTALKLWLLDPDNKDDALVIYARRLMGLIKPSAKSLAK
jgi:hypothetical protein